jgi:hypothetical protein
MNRTSRRARGCASLAALAIGFVAYAAAADEAAPEAVREAAAEHVQASGGEMTFDEPNGRGRVTLAFDHVHDGVKATEGERQVVCVDFKSADGTVYDVDFYVDRAEASGELLVEDAVIHKVSGKNLLPDARRAELDRAE